MDFSDKSARCVSNKYASITIAIVQITYGDDGTATVTYTNAEGDFPGDNISAWSIPKQERNITNNGYDYVYTRIDSAERISNRSVKFAVTGRWMLSGSTVKGSYWATILIMSY